MKKDYTKYSETSNNTEKEELIQAQLKVMSDESDQNEEIKALDDCTIDELLEISIKENVIITAEATKEELIAAINENRNQMLGLTNVDNTLEDQDQESLEIDKDHTGDIAPATITGCTKLNVRKEPSKDSEVVCIITEDSTITVSRDESTEDFYKVYTNVNEVLYEGYCMKKFISIE